MLTKLKLKSCWITPPKVQKCTQKKNPKNLRENLSGICILKQSKGKIFWVFHLKLIAGGQESHFVPLPGLVHRRQSTCRGPFEGWTGQTPESGRSCRTAIPGTVKEIKNIRTCVWKFHVINWNKNPANWRWQNSYAFYSHVLYKCSTTLLSCNLYI